MTTRIFIQDVTLRDGMHAVRHRITPDNVARIVAALDAAGADAIEVRTATGLPAAHSITVLGRIPTGSGSKPPLRCSRMRG